MGHLLFLKAHQGPLLRSTFSLYQGLTILFLPSTSKSVVSPSSRVVLFGIYLWNIKETNILINTSNIYFKQLEGPLEIVKADIILGLLDLYKEKLDLKYHIC